MKDIKIEWDPLKARLNEKKHRISFEEAATTFFDEAGRLICDPDHSLDEDRFILLGRSWSWRLLVVCHCYRQASSVIRIISARKATKKERQSFGMN